MYIYKQETAIKACITFSVKTYNNFKMIDIIVYIKCEYVGFYSLFSKKNINLRCCSFV